MKAISLILLTLAIQTTLTANFAVIVAGSDGYWNYRHQADACHAYQILIKGGMPAENIILLAKDDIANNRSNPIKGKIFNKPNGPDVYEGCVIDYKGRDVTPENYLNIITGNAGAMQGIGSGRVLQSTENDRVFLNFADHGAPGLIAFPSSYLYANDLLNALKTMQDNKMYSQLVYYLEACESGSMFEQLDKKLGIYGVTAANAEESSWAYYCGSDAHAEGTMINSCLGDLFSIAWMEDTEAISTDLPLSQQFERVKKRTTQSHVCKWGDFSYTDEPVSDFLGKQPVQDEIVYDEAKAVDSRDAKLHYHYLIHQRERTSQSLKELSREIFVRKTFDGIFKILKKFHVGIPKAKTTDFECYRDLIGTFESGCGRFSDYGLKYLRSFFDICGSELVDKKVVKSVVEELCVKNRAFAA